MSAQQLAHVRYLVENDVRVEEGHQALNAALPLEEEGRGSTVQEGTAYAFNVLGKL